MFNTKCAVIGMVHVLPLPGSAGYGGDMRAIIDAAVEDAKRLADNGVDSVMVENMHDVPYLNGRVEPETTAAMTVVAQAVNQKVSLPVGVQLLAGANIDALGVAIAAGLEFIRVEGFVFAHIANSGMHESCAGELIRRRAALKAEHIKIFADIKKKHCSHAITADVSIADTVREAEFFRSDGVIVTGTSTGIAPSVEDVQWVRAAASKSVWIGSGISPANVQEFVPFCDAMVVGSSLKFEGKWNNHVEPERVQTLVKATKMALAKSGHNLRKR